MLCSDRATLAILLATPPCTSSCAKKWGLCLQDDTPSLVNSELLRWIMRLEEKSLPASALGKFP